MSIFHLVHVSRHYYQKRPQSPMKTRLPSSSQTLRQPKWSVGENPIFWQRYRSTDTVGPSEWHNFTVDSLLAYRDTFRRLGVARNERDRIHCRSCSLSGSGSLILLVSRVVVLWPPINSPTLSSKTV